jgi:hypothetical protein
MAYVFGIEGVPIFEMLTIISILLLVGLIFVLLELRRLNALIHKEKTDLERFESDLTELEKDEGKKSSDSIVEYIRGALAKGVPYAHIESSLLQRGWSKKKIDNILDSLTRK